MSAGRTPGSTPSGRSRRSPLHSSTHLGQLTAKRNAVAAYVLSGSSLQRICTDPSVRTAMSIGARCKRASLGPAGRGYTRSEAVADAKHVAQEAVGEPEMRLELQA